MCISLPTEKQRETFNLSRANGQSVTASSRAAGISRRTGSVWEKERVANATQLSSRRASALLTKVELGETYSQLVRSADVDPRDKVAAGKSYADLMGLNEPTRTQNVNINATVPASTLDLIRSRTAARLAARQQQALQAQPPAIDGRVEPPEESKADALSHPQNISTNSESGGK